MYRVISSVAVALLALSIGVAAAAADDIATCANATGDDAIAACSRLITRNPEDATAYLNRGVEYQKKGDHDRAIADYDEAIRIDPKSADAYYDRGNAYDAKGDHDRAIANYDEAIRIDPKSADAYYNRGLAYNAKGDHDRAIADYDRAIKLNPKDADAYIGRGIARRAKGDHDHAIADYDQAVRIDPKNAATYNNRGVAHEAKGDHDRAIADYDEAIRIDPKDADAYYNRGLAYNAKGDHDRAIADYDRAIKLNPKDADAYFNRGLAYEDQGDYDRAIADYDQALKVDPAYTKARQQRDRAEAALALQQAALKSPAARPQPALPPQPASPPATNERRVALVIGNSAYRSVAFLHNPRRDAEAIADALRQAGFQTVTLKSDLGRDALREALRAFRDAADAADWGLIYYAGHGIQIGKTNYLVPVDARLRDERDVEGEAISYGELEKSVSGAKALRLIILDACRVDLFEAQMDRRNPGRSPPRGLLPPPEPEPGMLIIYSAKDGQVAEDGDGANSPFALALVSQLKVPGREVRRLFDYVRDDVLRATNKRQMPFTYGSLPGDKDFFFVAGK